MNRIAGVFNLDRGPVSLCEVNQMIEGMKYQRLDPQRIWIDEEVGLGCTRVGGRAGEYDGHLLFHRSNLDGVMITLDGRIDNRGELLAALHPQLANRPAPFYDEEIVLAAYEKWGLECPRHLIGDFAFAIWEPKKHRLVCARDHFGVKPFYYSLTRGSFLFASTPQALLASGKVPPRIHEERIADFLVNPLEGVDKTSSFYVNVFRLPPAHTLVVQAGGITLERYWELCPQVQTALRSDEAHVEAFQELFSEAVRCRLQGRPAPASMLSGGMDSSAIVGMGRTVLAEAGRDPLHSFAVISNSSGTNRETAHISAVIQQGNLQSHVISETELSQCMEGLIQAIEAESEPFDCLMNLNRAVYLHAQAQGMHALLDGVDGDVLLSGSGHLIPLWRQAAYGAILEETVKADGLTAEYKLGRRELIDSFVSVMAPFAPEWVRALRRARRARNTVENVLKESIISRDFAVRSRLGERFARLDSHSPRPASWTQMEFHKIVLEHPFLTVGLERYERVASSFGIEARHPFTDVRLAEFCLSLPWQLKTQHGWTKMILRRALEPYLPPEVIWRKDKDSLMWEVNQSILKARAEYFCQASADERGELEPYIDTNKFMKCWQEYLTLGDETHAELIWSGAALALWLRQQRNIKAGALKYEGEVDRPEGHARPALADPTGSPVRLT